MSTKGLKILNFNSGFMPDKGGVATYSWELTKNLARSAKVEKVLVIAFNVSARGIERVADNYTIIRYLRTNFWLMGLKILWYSYKYREFDVIHATNLFPVGFWSMLGARLLGKKYYVTIYGTEVLTNLASPLTFRLKRQVMKSAAKVFCISRYTCQHTLRKYSLSANNFTVVYPGVSTSFTKKFDLTLKQTLGYGNDDFIVLTIGQLVVRKGMDDLIRAISLISDKKVKLLIVGRGVELNNLQSLVAELGLLDRVKFAGKVPEVESYYNFADVFCLTSRDEKESGDIEGFGLVLTEAQFRGIPVIGTNSGGIPEAMLDGQTGFIVPQRNSEAIAADILLLRENIALRKKMSLAAKEFVVSNLSWPKQVDCHLAVYQE
ncbi:MAG: glycosyltransferase family 4 protein [Candidatus Buchananbacteria bacterium]